MSRSPRPASGPTIASSWLSGSERYRLTTSADLDAIAQMLGDPEVARWLWFTPISRADAIAYFEPLVAEQHERIESGALPEVACFTVEDAESGAFLGQGAAAAVAGSALGFEIGFQLHRQAWGHGVGTRLSHFLCRFAAEALGAYRIEGACLAGNGASAALLRNLGLRLEGTLIGYRLRDGVRHDELRFGAPVHDLDLERLSLAVAQDAVGNLIR